MNIFVLRDIDAVSHIVAKFLTRLCNSVSIQTVSSAKTKVRRGKACSFPGISVAESRKGRSEGVVASGGS